MSYFFNDIIVFMEAEIALTPELVRAARNLIRWSQHDLAAKAGVAVSTVADFERGQRSPVLNNALAIRVALETAGVVFTEGGVSHGFHWTFMTERGTSSLHVTFAPEDAAVVLDFASMFGAVALPKVSINKIQSATPELKHKLSSFIERYRNSMPHLQRLKKMLNDLGDREFFLILPAPLASTAERYEAERFLHQLNHPEERSFEAEQRQIFGALLDEYDLSMPRTDKRVDIGNARKKGRTCRFCHRTIAMGAKFDKEAHAIPAGLGNKYLKLADECDDCNQYFGDEVEPTLVELLNIQRVFLGIAARGSRPNIEFAGGKMFHDGERMVVVSDKISEDASGVLSAQLGREKYIVPMRFYQALSKIALSVIPEAELAALKRTIGWVRYGSMADMPIPKVAAAIVPLSPEPSAQITLYIRKKDVSRLPHVVCEFRLGCYIYVYALPFSDRDNWNLIEFFEDNDFKGTFRHYSYVPSWILQDYGNAREISLVQNISFAPRNA
ncbi:helix-turn-helix domain-containing protein [Burkholderia gladioli]|uniref:helix-turn-helix domain-containing protein n=1 Tax=Burkholderia gladioli TaxID=28095 RepID=UPI00163F1291|nr:helix-turn-helix domain-containing protein [Burkholderia gladioli]